MQIVLARIDDRFIHGQVTVGWSRVLSPDQIILCNDDVAADPWQQRVYASSVPPQMDVHVLSRNDTCRRLCPNAPGAPGQRSILLVGDPADMLALIQGGLKLSLINIGGMHFRNGKKELLDQIYVDLSDLGAMRKLLKTGAELQVQSVPGAPTSKITMQMLDAAEEAF